MSGKTITIKVDENFYRTLYSKILYLRLEGKIIRDSVLADFLPNKLRRYIRMYPQNLNSEQLIEVLSRGVDEDEIINKLKELLKEDKNDQD